MKENMIYNTNIYQLREPQILRILNIIQLNKSSNSNGTLFFGDSITQLMDINKYFEKTPIKYNCGIAGFTSECLLLILDEAVIKFKPSHLVLMIGTNDLGETVMSSPREIALRIKDIVEITTNNLPSIKITLISPIPCIEKIHGNSELRGLRNNLTLKTITKEIKYFLKHFTNIEIIDLFDNFLDPSTGDLIYRFTDDGLHLNEEGYLLYTEIIKSKSKFL
ncbi:MAG: SGNH/GDSL hydrolase family protein [Clostridium sp.]|uniref:SGNH/GDSL hydrolase family protein n=1 Tax=Clostridium chrysemydis TaxID=2665504 RepID=UPI003EE69F84